MQMGRCIVQLAAQCSPQKFWNGSHLSSGDGDHGHIAGHIICDRIWEKGRQNRHAELGKNVNVREEVRR